jgi:BirA family biotin operon repressor/biotin-[acetyl-CoA-carboxylase] ligase
MEDAARLAADGAPHLSCVVANEQTAGQGRHGHSWLSPRGGLYTTILLRLERPAPIVTLALGLAVRDTIAVPCDLRWPNDVMVGPKKLAGILTTLHGDAILAGIGINLTDPGHPDAAWLTGADRDALLDELLIQVDRHVTLPHPEILRLFSQASSYVHGRRVQVEGHGLGTTQGLTPDGFLLFKKDGGGLTTIYAGGVRPA